MTKRWTNQKISSWTDKLKLTFWSWGKWGNPCVGGLGVFLSVFFVVSFLLIFDESVWIICFVGVLLCSQVFIVNVGVSIWNESLPKSLFEWLCCHLKKFGGNYSSFARGLLLVNDSWIFALFSSSPVLASAVCLCCCHFDMSNRLVASVLFTHLCLFYFVFLVAA